MRALTLEYHDVIENDAWDGSGFPGRAAATYKLAIDDFEAHLRALAYIEQDRRRLAIAVHADPDNGTSWPVMLTFDDGGTSACPLAADLLEANGWRGHFFVSTDRIGTPGFLDMSGLRELRRRGHVVGSHSSTHPLRMSACDDARLDREWVASRDRLSEILGETIATASVPGGGYSTRVAVRAAAAGYRCLFTSEPIVRTSLVGECRVFGRFTMRRDSSARQVASFIAGRGWPRYRQWLAWNARKALKAGGGSVYLAARSRLFGDPGEPGAGGS